MFFFFNDTATTEIYTLSLHDALPISLGDRDTVPSGRRQRRGSARARGSARRACRSRRSEEHTSELQSQSNLVCRLLLEKKKKAKGLLRRRHLHMHAVTDQPAPLLWCE